MSKVKSLFYLSLNKIMSDPNLIIESLKENIPNILREKILDHLFRDPYKLYGVLNNENLDQKIFKDQDLLNVAVEIYYNTFVEEEFLIPELKIDDVLKVFDIMINFTDFFNENDDAFIYFLLYKYFHNAVILDKFKNTREINKAIGYLRVKNLSDTLSDDYIDIYKEDEIFSPEFDKTEDGFESSSEFEDFTEAHELYSEEDSKFNFEIRIEEELFRDVYRTSYEYYYFIFEENKYFILEEEQKINLSGTYYENENKRFVRFEKNNIITKHKEWDLKNGERILILSLDGPDMEPNSGDRDEYLKRFNII